MWSAGGVIHGGVRDTISLQFYRLRPNAPPIAKLPPDAEQNYLGTNCDILNPIPYHIVAQDGLTTAEASKTRLATLQPATAWTRWSCSRRWAPIAWWMRRSPPPPTWRANRSARACSAWCARASARR